MPSVLFVCRANQFRSPLAAAFLAELIASKHSREEWRVGSAGTWTKPGLPASSEALRVANRRNLPGLDLHSTQEVSQELLDQYDLILTMEAGQREAIITEFHDVSGRTMLLAEVVDDLPYDVPDPVGLKSDPDEVAADLQLLIKKGGPRS